MFESLRLSKHDRSIISPQTGPQVHYLGKNHEKSIKKNQTSVPVVSMPGNDVADHFGARCGHGRRWPP